MDQQLLQNLRIATRPAHDRLEDIVDGARLMNPPFDPAHYACLLRAHLEFNRLVNQQFSSDIHFERAVPSWPDKERIKALREDLKSLGAYAPEAGPVNVSTVLENAAYVVGLCYVAEGAAMGNQMIYKALQQFPAYKALNAERYMQISKAGLSARWKNFQTALEAYLTLDEASVIAGAKAGFQHFEYIWSILQERS